MDYSIPRITHIKNDDFEYLALVDRNYESKKAFGILTLRDKSQTPYANVGPVNNAPVNPSEFLSVPYVEVRVEETTKEEPAEPKVENIVDVKNNFGLNSAYKTPIIHVRPSVLNIYSLDQATSSQPKEEKNRSPPSTHENFSTGMNENRSFIMISSSSRKDRVKCFQGTRHSYFFLQKRQNNI